MNYIKLQLGNKERGAKLGLGLLQKIQESENINIDQVFAKIKDDYINFVPKLMYQSLAFNCERAKEKLDFDYYDVLDWVSEVGVGKEGPVTEFVNAFITSVTKQFPEGFLEQAEEQGKIMPQKKAASTDISGSKK